MKNFLRFLAMAAFTGAIALLCSACDKDDIRPMVEITGSFSNTPNPLGGFNQVPMPDGSAMTFPKQYIVDGTCNLLGDIMEGQSVLEALNPAFEPRYGFKGEVKITLTGANGDKLFFEGEFLMFQDMSNKSFLHIVGGTGKFEDAQGWFNATGQMNPETGVNTITGAGEVTEPEKK